MSEWWTYELSNFLLFSPRTYDRLVESYNAAMWPGHALAVLSGIAIAILTLRRGKRASLAAAALLALVWLWVAWAFHFQRYSPINWAARWFAVAFGIEGMMILASEWRSRATTDGSERSRNIAGPLLAMFAILALPVTERVLGVPWTRVEVFALFPDATAVATLGILISRERLQWHLLPIPFLWCLIGAGTLAAMDRADAVIIAAAAVLAFALVVWRVLERRGTD